MLTVVAPLWDANEKSLSFSRCYDESWVEKLYAGFCRHLTRPFRFSGSRLSLNFATSAGGGIRVELQDGDGKTLPGYGLDDCRELIGNEIDRSVLWKGVGSDVSGLAGRVVRARFVMRDADLYSLRFQ